MDSNRGGGKKGSRSMAGRRSITAAMENPPLGQMLRQKRDYARGDSKNRLALRRTRFTMPGDALNSMDSPPGDRN
jgi:hypothetical protein